MNFYRLGTLSVLAAVTFVALDSPLKVERTKLDVRADKTALSLVAFTAAQGDTLNIVEETPDGWLKVAKADGSQSGYVRKALVTQSQLKMEAAKPSISGTGSQNADASAAARGVDPDVLTYANGKNLDPKAVDLMIDLRNSITASDLAEFKSTGGLR